jgi:4-hydroxythreonine-4-phosphate dehydrogenase
MAFVGASVRVALVTVHMPLRQVVESVTTDLVLHTIAAADQALRGQLGLQRARIAVCGLNPHAGDDGLLGHEDAAVVLPAVQAACAAGMDAFGPVSAEHAFVLAVRGEADLVVAMYHDQGLAPLKALDFGRSVNWTVGLPIIRTSVDHGTADDIAGTGVADPGSMHAAIALAEQLAGSTGR